MVVKSMLVTDDSYNRNKQFCIVVPKDDKYMVHLNDTLKDLQGLCNVKILSVSYQYCAYSSKNALVTFEEVDK